MVKNDRLKEELAESRHNERMALMWVTCGFGALAAALAYGAWQEFGPSFIVMMVILISGFIGIWIAASRSRMRRRDSIRRLDDK